MFDKNKESKTTCPHCHKNLPNGVLAYYLINKMTDVTQCPHCKTDIKLQKNITKFSYWQSIIVAIGFNLTKSRIILPSNKADEYNTGVA